MTTNLREFFNRGKSHKASKREEQDLKGFGGGACVCRVQGGQVGFRECEGGMMFKG